MSDAFWTGFFSLAIAITGMVGSVLLQLIRAKYNVVTYPNGFHNRAPAPPKLPQPPDQSGSRGA